GAARLGTADGLDVRIEIIGAGVLEELLCGGDENALIVFHPGPEFRGGRQGLGGELVAENLDDGKDVLVLVVPIGALDFLRAGGAVYGEDLRYVLRHLLRVERGRRRDQHHGVNHGWRNEKGYLGGFCRTLAKERRGQATEQNG